MLGCCSGGVPRFPLRRNFRTTFFRCSYSRRQACRIFPSPPLRGAWLDRPPQLHRPPCPNPARRRRFAPSPRPRRLPLSCAELFREAFFHCLRDRCADMPFEEFSGWREQVCTSSGAAFSMAAARNGIRLHARTGPVGGARPRPHDRAQGSAASIQGAADSPLYVGIIQHPARRRERICACGRAGFPVMETAVGLAHAAL